MTDWTTARVQDRLELAADVFAQLPGVKPQGYFSAWPAYFHSFGDQVGQEPRMRRPLPSPRMITAGWSPPMRACSGSGRTGSRGSRSAGNSASAVPLQTGAGSTGSR